MKQTRLDQIKKAHNAFVTAQQSLKKYGAQDSEPSWVYHDGLRNALFGEPLTIPSTNAFQLYQSVPGFHGANMELFRKANKVVNLIPNTPLKESGTVRAWVKDTAWRVDIA